MATVGNIKLVVIVIGIIILIGCYVLSLYLDTKL